MKYVRTFRAGEVMPCFSPLSVARLATCHVDLQRLFNEVVKEADCTVICGHRGEAEQDAAVADGCSKDPWPTSRHDADPSDAVDVAPYPIDWQNLQAFRDFAVVVKAAAARLGIAVEWGGDWNSFKDYPHWQVPRAPVDKLLGSEALA